MGRIDDLAVVISDAQFDAYETLGLVSLPDDTSRLDEEIKRNLMESGPFSKADRKSIKEAVDIVDNKYNAHESADVAIKLAYNERR